MNFRHHLCGGAALGALVALSLAPVAHAAAAAPKHHKKHVAHAAAPAATAAEVSALREQLTALQARLDAQDAALAQAKQDAAARIAAISAQSSQSAEQTRVIQSEVAAVPAEIKKQVAAAAPKTDKVYYKGVSITLGGFLAAEGVYRQHSESADIASSYGNLPLGNVASKSASEFRETARQSRISALVQGNINPTTHATFYGEFDFLGAAQTANSKEANAYNPRIRQVFGEVTWDDLGLDLAAGQMWSLTTEYSKGLTPRSELLPPQIDAQYIPGFVWTRTPEVRVTKSYFNKSLTVAVSAENPQSVFVNAPATLITSTYAATGASSATSPQATGSLFNSLVTYSYNHYPDLVGKVAYDTKFMDRPVHLEAFGLGRDFYTLTAANGAGHDKWGVSFGGAASGPIVPNLLDFQISAMRGRGIGRYGSSGMNDATFDPNGNVKPIAETAILSGVTLHPNPTLDLYLFGGEEAQDSQAYRIGTTYYGFGDTNPNDSGCALIGGTCAGKVKRVDQVTFGFWHKFYQGPFGRLQWGLQYSYTENALFPGSLGGGSTADSMVFSSFRYYPF